MNDSHQISKGGDFCDSDLMFASLQAVTFPNRVCCLLKGFAAVGANSFL